MAEQLSSHPPGHNGPKVLPGVTQAEFIDWLDKMRGLDEAVAAAVDRRKAYLAEIKQRIGKDEFASFKSVRKDAEMPGESRERREMARRQMMRWLNKPLGFQASLDLPGDDAAVIALNVHELHRVDSEGQGAGQSGRRRDSNPYTPGTELAQRWDTAWLRGQANIAATLSPTHDGNGGERPSRRRGRPRKDQTAQIY